MRIIFLDFDGVLNDVRRAKLSGLTNISQKLFDSSLVKLLNQIVTSTGARVVISSNWRRSNPMSSIHDALAKAGFKGHIMGHTGVDRRGNRGVEIAQWLDAFYRKTGEHPHYVILDDIPITGHTDRHVRTDPFRGLTPADARKAIEMFEE